MFFNDNEYRHTHTHGWWIYFKSLRNLLLNNENAYAIREIELDTKWTEPKEQQKTPFKMERIINNHRGKRKEKQKTNSCDYGAKSQTETKKSIGETEEE